MRRKVPERGKGSASASESSGNLRASIMLRRNGPERGLNLLYRKIQGKPRVFGQTRQK
jgi:hypothetical protein